MKKSKIPFVILGELVILILVFLLAKDVTQVSEIASLLPLLGILIVGSYFTYKKLTSAK